MSDLCYTAITFSPVQGFIEKSRKLRDLYGSSFILSYLARSLCNAATNQGHRVISPALINLTQGTPNQIILQGNFDRSAAQTALRQAWKTIVHSCRQWIETQIKTEYTWYKNWEQWVNHTWEFFWAQGDSISAARRAINERKRQRDWTGINWQGESSTLSGTDAIAYPGMGRPVSPKDRNLSAEDKEIRQFYRQLQQIPTLGEAFVDEREQLSIPELIKRLITYSDVAKQLKDLADSELPSIEIPDRFRDLSQSEYRGWFQGDGDSIGQLLRSMAESGQDEARTLNQFSQAMLDWGKDLKQHITDGRLIYAGGDDFLGVFYHNDPTQPPLTAQTCLNWFYRFPDIWQQHQQPITVSVGFVWASPNVPQRDVLQHCREAEQSAKKQGRDRLALRILFSGGNSLEWVCPWWFLDVLESYCDRNDVQGSSNKPNWAHIYNDVAILESRHAFEGQQADVALSLFTVYFGEDKRDQLKQHLWNDGDKTGILGNRPEACSDQIEALNDWIINLAKVGFHLSASH